MRRIILFVLLAALAAARPCTAQQDVAGKGQQKQEVRDLIAILKDKSNIAEAQVLVADAIIALGELKAVEAIPDLIEHIDFQDPRGETGRFGPYSVLDRRVAVDALVKIGKPSLTPVLEAGKKEDDRIRLICMAAVIRRVGAEDKEGMSKLKERMNVAITQSLDPVVKSRLEKLNGFILNPPAM